MLVFTWIWIHENIVYTMFSSITIFRACTQKFVCSEVDFYLSPKNLHKQRSPRSWHFPSLHLAFILLVGSKLNLSQEVYYNSSNPLVEEVSPLIFRPPPGGPHIFRVHKYSGASGQGCPYFPVAQFIELQYSVLSKQVIFNKHYKADHVYTLKSWAQTLRAWVPSRLVYPGSWWREKGRLCCSTKVL